MTSSLQDEITDISRSRPHVVILGAGASLAAFPNGDRNQHKLPLMSNFVEVVGLGAVLEQHGINYNGVNFESCGSAGVFKQKVTVSDVTWDLKPYMSARNRLILLGLCHSSALVQQYIPEGARGAKTCRHA